MTNRVSKLILTAGAACGAVFPGIAQAQQTAGRSDTLSATAEHQDFSRDYGSLDTVRIEYKDVMDETTIVLSPVAGRRRTTAGDVTAVGGGAEIYHDWSDTVSTRTAAFVSEDKPVFAKLDIAQDVTVKFAASTSATLGVRWSEYASGDKVLFTSAGLRQYFKGGSVAYRLTYAKPDGRDGYLAHLVNLVVNDARGRGKTQLWASYGGNSLDRGGIEDTFTGHDYGGVIRRVQPIGSSLDLIMMAGLTSYDRPAGRVLGTSLGLGLAVAFGK